MIPGSHLPCLKDSHHRVIRGRKKKSEGGSEKIVIEFCTWEAQRNRAISDGSAIDLVKDKTLPHNALCSWTLEEFLLISSRQWSTDLLEVPGSMKRTMTLYYVHCVDTPLIELSKHPICWPVSEKEVMRKDKCLSIYCLRIRTYQAMSIQCMNMSKHKHACSCTNSWPVRSSYCHFSSTDWADRPMAILVPLIG